MCLCELIALPNLFNQSNVFNLFKLYPLQYNWTTWMLNVTTRIQNDFFFLIYCNSVAKSKTYIGRLPWDV